VPFALSGVCLVAGVALASVDLTVLGALNLLGQVVYLISALRLVRAPRSTYLALSTAPLYIAWKLGLYGRALLGSRATSWVRTARVVAPDAARQA